MAALDSIEPADDELNVLTGGEPTYAPFSPSSTSSFFGPRPTILIKHKSPLLLATPPQITRALVYADTFLQPLNRILGLLTWSSDDQWQSFLMLTLFWTFTLYGDLVLQYTGPLLLIVVLLLGMWSRRFSSLSHNAVNESGLAHSRSSSADIKDGAKRPGQQKSLDDIVANLQILTTRANIVLAPFFQLTDFLSTQMTPTSSSTRPALTTLFVRLLLISPLWYGLTLPPLSIITARRIIFVLGTLALTWHSRTATVSRVVLWRSKTIRKVVGALTGLTFSLGNAGKTHTKARELAKSASTRNLRGKFRAQAPAPRYSASDTTARISFPFVLYENQRRWLGLGWTSSMLAYDRAPWTDEELNPAKPRAEFELPKVEGGLAQWRWTEDDWHVGLDPDDPDAKGLLKPGEQLAEDRAWVYMDSQWRFPRTGVDGWGKYTRRRRWLRDAELVDIAPAGSASGSASGSTSTSPRLGPAKANGHAVEPELLSPSKRSWFRRGTNTSTASGSGAVTPAAKTPTATTTGSTHKDDDDGYVPLRFRGRQGPSGMDEGVGEDAGMALG